MDLVIRLNVAMNSKFKIFVLGEEKPIAQEIHEGFKGHHWTSLLSSDVCNDVLTMRRTLNKHKPDIIINCISLDNIEQCEEQGDEAVFANALVVRKLIRASLKSKVSNVKIVHLSTNYIFDGKNEAYSEEDQPTPINKYGDTKLMGEKFLKSLYTNYLIIRTSNLYCNKGTDFINALINLYREKETVEMINDCFVSLTNSENLIQALIQLINREYVGVFHFCNAGEATPYDIAQYILLKMKSLNQLITTKKMTPIKRAQLQLKAKRPKRINLLCNKFETFTETKIPTWQKSLGIFLERNFA